MNLIIKNDCINVDWENVATILEKVGLASFSCDVRKKAFENSYVVVFIYDDEKLIGCGRAISDGAYEAAIYDIAVKPEYQGKGVGRIIVQNIIQNLPGCNVILFATPGKEAFYGKLNFRKMKTGMAVFRNPERMHSKGFIE
ncbi:MAG: GNAT family N-acetyltransferase [Desulfitobacterium sp.]